MTADRILRPTDAEWPSRLNELAGDSPPEQLHVRGRLLEPGRTSIAIVGTRRPTVSGIEIATTMARAFAEAGFVVVSGLAMGIDAAAHKACLEAGGHTVAVLGCGLDVDYPRANAKLRGVIGKLGTLVTEYEDGTEPHAYNFPKRNRIVAGLVHAVVVVEGGTKSGSLITARLGIEYGREVFAVPGNPRNLMSIAPNELIRTGQAALAACPEHVFEVLAPQQAWLEPCDTRRMRSAPSVDEEELAALFALDEIPTIPERIAAAANLAPGRVSMVLAKLEVRGLVRKRRMGYEITATGAAARATALEK
ncbi:MAG: DNA-protecting protein DprA, partial [Actinobacteria bacterium]|nr:DNA-protecting protein DprA [Actinomycetota bacterium]